MIGYIGERGAALEPPLEPASEPDCEAPAPERRGGFVVPGSGVVMDRAGQHHAVLSRAGECSHGSVIAIFVRI